MAVTGFGVARPRYLRESVAGLGNHAAIRADHGGCVSEGFWNKGRIAARSARLLLDAADAHGAVDRAYFAMFHIARASLAHADPELARTKRHATVIGRFGR